MTDNAVASGTREAVGLVGASLTPRWRRSLASYARTGDHAESARILGIVTTTQKQYVWEAVQALGVEDTMAALRVLGWLTVPEEE